MTEAEWLAATDPAPLLILIRGEASERKRRLFACGCCRLAWDLLTDGRSRAVVELAERYADGKASDGEVLLVTAQADSAVADLHGAAFAALEAARGKTRHFVTRAYRAAGAADAARMTIWSSPDIYPYPWTTDCGGGPYDGLSISLSRAGYERVFSERGDICRCVFGNPFRPVTADPLWLTSTVVALAAQMYESRDFSAMLILADALEDTGCDSDDVLDHCRGPGPHVRGCWVVDLVLGKA